MTAARDVRRLLADLARRPGWSVVLRKGGHYRIRGPGCLYFTSSTPSDRRAIKNLRADLRRRGARIP